MLRAYETLYVIRTDAADDRAAKVKDKVSKTVQSHSGTVLGFDDWGVRKLAYEIQKEGRGSMTLVGFCAAPTAILELERELRYDDAVVRFSTRVLGEAKDPATSKKEFEARVEADKTARAEAEVEERERKARYEERRRERNAERDARRGDRPRFDRGDRDNRDAAPKAAPKAAPDAAAAEAAPAAAPEAAPAAAPAAPAADAAPAAPAEDAKGGE